MSESGRAYGTEYKTLAQVGNIKIIQNTISSSAKFPMETMTKGRIYGLVNMKGELKGIAYFDKHNKRMKQVDIDHYHPVHGKKEKPHVHKGYIHNEKGDGVPSPKEKKMIDLVSGIWYKGIGRL